MKGIIVVDIPKYCRYCQFCNRIEEEEICCSLADDENETDCFRVIENYFQERPDWCPIKPIPEGKPAYMSMCLTTQECYQNVGWNKCIDEILKRGKE